MLKINTKKNFYLPVVALLPCFVYTLLHFLGIEPFFSIGAALVISIIGDIVSRYVIKNWAAGLVFMIITLSLLLTMVCLLIFRNIHIQQGFYFIIFEISTVILITLFRINKLVVKIFYVRKKDLLQKKILRNIYDIGLLIGYLFGLHIFASIIYKFLENAPFMRLYDSLISYILFTIAPLAITVLVICYELFKANALSRKLKKEEWLPIITENGDVTGKIAKSVSVNMNDKFRHPIVRTVLICGEKLYLQERKIDDILSPDKLDYPFEKYTLFSHGIEEAVRNNIKHMMVDNNTVNMDVQYIMKYTFENDNTKRLIFLFSARINDDEEIKKTERMTGKFWTIKQVEDAFADEVFSENFELEFEYLKNMILKKMKWVCENKSILFSSLSPDLIRVYQILPQYVSSRSYRCNRY